MTPQNTSRTTSFTPRETPHTGLESSSSASCLTEQTNLGGVSTHQRMASMQAPKTTEKTPQTADLSNGEAQEKQAAIWNPSDFSQKMPANIFANVAAADNTFVPKEESIALSRELATEIAQSIFKKAVVKNNANLDNKTEESKEAQ